MEYKEKDYIRQLDENAERRFYPSDIEVRGEEDDKMIRGTAAVVGVKTDLGWFDEMIDPNAFRDSSGHDSDVVALFNHNPDIPLARTTAEEEARLHLTVGKKGDLEYNFNTPNTNQGRDLEENIRTGVISKSSFAFVIDTEEWKYADSRSENDRDLRIIKKFKRLYDISPVTYPAYQDTDVALRSLKKYQGERRERTKFLRKIFNIKYKVK